MRSQIEIPAMSWQLAAALRQYEENKGSRYYAGGRWRSNPTAREAESLGLIEPRDHGRFYLTKKGIDVAFALSEATSAPEERRTATRSQG